MSLAPGQPTGWTYVWKWRKLLPERYGSRCRVLASSAGNMGLRVRVEFEDGLQIEAHRTAIKAGA